MTTVELLTLLLALVVLGSSATCLYIWQKYCADVRRLTEAIQKTPLVSSDLAALNAGGLGLPKLRDAFVKVLTDYEALYKRARRSSHEARLFLNGTLDAIVVLDAKGRITYFSASAERLLCVHAREVTGKSFAEIAVAKHSRSLIQRTLSSLPENGSTGSAPGRIEVAILGSDSVEFPAELSFGRVSLDGQLYFPMIIREATDAVRRRDELQIAKDRAEREQRSITAGVEALGDAFALFDSADRLLFCNSSSRTQYAALGDFLTPGVTYEEILREGVRRGQFPGVSKDPEAWIRQRVESHRTVTAGFEYTMPNGRHVRVTERRTTAGDTVGFSMDITELKNAQALAESANQAKTLFLANLSHEIRTPLHGILGALDLLLDEPLTEQQSGVASLARRSTDTLLGLVTQLLDFSKIDTGHVRVSESEFSIGEEIGYVVRAQQKGPSPPKVDVRVKIASDIPGGLLADVVKLRQILANLISNAAKFTDHGHIEVSAKVSGTDKEMLLELVVSDTGIGIAASDQASLFQPFTQGNDSLSRNHGGMGLGLAITKSLVTAMRGSISVQSLWGRGTKFLVNLPVRVVTKAAHALTASLSGTDTPATLPVKPLAGLRVLVVEDTPANQELAKALLSRRGAEVEVSSCGQDALLAVAARNFDVVLMDVHMPVMDGFSTTQRIRAGGLGGNAKVPIIAVTAHALEGDRERCIAMGMNGYLSKPYQADALIRLILKVTGTSSTATFAGGPPARLAEAGSFAKAREYVGDDEESFRAVVAKMLELLPDIEAVLKDHSDPARIRNGMHQLKGSWSLFVDEETGKLPGTIENHLTTRGLDAMALALLAHLESEVVALQQKLKNAVC